GFSVQIRRETRKPCTPRHLPLVIPRLLIFVECFVDGVYKVRAQNAALLATWWLHGGYMVATWWLHGQ
ncbi:hypothetical protein, partial [Hydrogenophaga sp.]|uniref:hypothetical protein n=1 Tax=Hydrogenophaga sp. TaxID=1904254 RepID=UPI0035640668